MKQLLWILISIVVFIDIGYSQTVLPKGKWRDGSGYQYLTLDKSDTTLRVSGTFTMSPDSTKERRWIMIDNWSSMPSTTVTVDSTSASRSQVWSRQSGTWTVAVDSSKERSQIYSTITNFPDSSKQRAQLYASVTNTVTTTESTTPTSFGTMTNLNLSATSTTQLGSNACKYVTIVVDLAELDTIYVGGSGVTNNNGIPLTAGDCIRLPISNTSSVYVYSSPGAGRIRYYWEN